MHWVYLAVAIALELCGTTCMKLSHGFTRFWPSVLFPLFFVGSLSMATLATKVIPVSVTYAIWSAVGMAVVTVIGVIGFKEPVNALKIASIALIIIGVIGLNLSGRTP